MESTFSGIQSTFLGMRLVCQEVNLKKQHFLWAWSSIGVHSEFSRSSVGGIEECIREVKETAILIKSLFCISDFFGRSLVSPWFVVGLLPERIWVGTKEGNLKNW
jgi:hypothetical protein